MKTLCINFFRRNLGFFKLAVVSNLEYRLNFLLDVVIQPLMGSVIEIIVWIAFFQMTQSKEVAGFNQQSYLGYSLWAGFISRVTANWMYEFRMINDIETGAVNSKLIRPMNFFEYYLSQFLGYKFVTTAGSFLFPWMISYFMGLPCLTERIPLALLLAFYYLFFTFLISFIIATMAFYFTKVGSFTVAKNFIIILLSGDLFPLDMIPPVMRAIVYKLPFIYGTFVPTAYIVGRVQIDQVWSGFVNLTLAILGLGVIARWAWQRAVVNNVGIGA